MRLRRRLPALLLATAAAATPVTAADGATWSAPQTVTATPHTFAGPLSLTTTFDGSLIAAWPWQDNAGTDARGGASTAARPPLASFAGGAPATSAFTAERPAPDGLVALAPFGRTQTLALALQGLPGRSGPTGAILQRLKVAFGAAGGGFGTARTLVTAAILGRPQLAAAGSRALISWIEVTRTSSGATRRVVRAIERRDGRFGAPFTLSGRGRADVLAVALGQGGDEAVAFVRQGDVLARVRRPGHRWGSVQRVARATGPTHWQLVAAADARGQVRLIWRRHQFRQSATPGRTALEGTAMLVGRGRFAAVQTIEPDGASAPALTLAAGGWALADVQATPEGPRPTLHRTHGGLAFGGAQYAGPAQGGLRGTAVAFSPVGGIVVAWVQPLPGQDGAGEARAASLDPGVPDAAFGPVEAISPAEAVSEVALGADGRAGQPVAVWIARPDNPGPSVPLADVHTVVRSAIRVP
ncbi:MAG: hypothetical protein QOF26_2036 [Baekduia sp.]|nr:hypothetical protein [Baekduia sp.]